MYNLNKHVYVKIVNEIPKYPSAPNVIIFEKFRGFLDIPEITICQFLRFSHYHNHTTYTMNFRKSLKLVNHATFPVTTNEAVETSFTTI